MKKTILTGLLMLGTSTLLANTLTLDWAPNHSPSGGEFIITPAGSDPFRSFCIERNEHVNPFGNTYTYVENNQAVGGGLGGPHPDPISIGTAWLYRQFRDGTLGSYDTSNTANQSDLQNAFWWLEQEIGTLDIDGNPEPAYDPTTNLYLSEALTALGGTLAGLQADADGAYNVGVYNLYNLDGTLAQDQLALVPDGGSTLLMLGLGLTGFAFVSRKIRK
jgi:hypothetical protein